MIATLPSAPTGPPPAEDDYLDTLRAALVDTNGLDDIPEPEPLVDGILYLDSLTWIQGKRSNGKSFVALDIAGCVGTGEIWHGHPVKQGSVLYIAAEGVSGMRWRVRAWEQAMGRRMENVKWLPMPVQANSSHWADLIALAVELKPSLIVIDTQARVTVGMEENAAKDMGEFVEKLERLRRETGACVMVVHHQGHNGEHMRGSTALEGAAATIIRAQKDEDEITIGCAKQKDAKEFGEFILRLTPMGESAVLMQTDFSTHNTGRLNAALKMAREWHDMFGTDEVSVSRLVKAIDAPERTTYRHISALVGAGKAAKRMEGKSAYYRLLIAPDPASGAWS